MILYSLFEVEEFSSLFVIVLSPGGLAPAIESPAISVCKRSSAPSMDLKWTPMKSVVSRILSVSLLIGFFMQVAVSDRQLRRDIRVTNNFTNTISMISSLSDRETDLQLRCAVGISSKLLILLSRLIEQGQSHTWTIDVGDHENSTYIACSLMVSIAERYSLKFCIDPPPWSPESKEDWLVSEGGLSSYSSRNFSAQWNLIPVSEQRINTVSDQAVRTLNILITVSNIMQGANAEYTRVDMQCTAIAKEQKRSLGTVSILAWQSHVWRLTQRDNNPDTVFCTFDWIDDFHQRYIMDSNIFDSKSRTSGSGGTVRRKYFVTKAGLATGVQEVYVAQWTKAIV